MEACEEIHNISEDKILSVEEKGKAIGLSNKDLDKEDRNAKRLSKPSVSLEYFFNCGFCYR